jgi:D-alanyl-D-alanine carboxypeptidase (penicillin-binding protein 5/6)
VHQDVYVTFPRGQDNTLSAAADLSEPMFAPLSTDKSTGKLRVQQGNQLVGTYDLYPLADVPEAGLFSRLIDDVKLWLH